MTHAVPPPAGLLHQPLLTPLLLLLPHPALPAPPPRFARRRRAGPGLRRRRAARACWCWDPWAWQAAAKRWSCGMRRGPWCTSCRCRSRPPPSACRRGGGSASSGFCKRHYMQYRQAGQGRLQQTSGLRLLGTPAPAGLGSAVGAARWCGPFKAFKTYLPPTALVWLVYCLLLQAPGPVARRDLEIWTWGERAAGGRCCGAPPTPQC